MNDRNIQLLELKVLGFELIKMLKIKTKNLICKSMREMLKVI